MANKACHVVASTAQLGLIQALGAMEDTHLLGAMYLGHAGAFRHCINVLLADMDKDKNGLPAKMACLPVYYLASHVIELLLKAALLKRDVTSQELKAVDTRHNLAKLAEMLSGLVTISNQTRALITNLSDQHKRHFLRYGGPTALPHPEWLMEGLDEILQLCAVSGTSGGAPNNSFNPNPPRGSA